MSPGRYPMVRSARMSDGIIFILTRGGRRSGRGAEAAFVLRIPHLQSQPPCVLQDRRRSVSFHNVVSLFTTWKSVSATYPDKDVLLVYDDVKMFLLGIMRCYHIR